MDADADRAEEIPVLDAGAVLEGSGRMGLGLGPDGRPTHPAIVIDAARLARIDGTEREKTIARLHGSDAIVVMTADEVPAPELADLADVLLIARGSGRDAVTVADPRAAAAAVVRRIASQPCAALALVWLLRSSESLPVSSALIAESSTYSMLLVSREFKSWLASRPPRRDPGGSHRVTLSRAGDVLRVSLDRPDRRNAVDAAMRDALYDGLLIAVADPTVLVSLDAVGPSFCAGGDLDEFGRATDPAAAHLVRSAISVGRLAALLRDRLTVRVHGACVGAGVELPAFAGRVVAAADTWFWLPEIAMGLIPGAGGTVSLPRRIGRRRTAWLALSGRRLDVDTALGWGLVDAIE
jgi:Enoyl-CoA hydratase/isomerase